MPDGENGNAAEERRRAAVLVALRTGLLKKCPVHGDVYDSGRHDYQGALMTVGFLINQSDPLVAPFAGDRAGLGELLKSICQEHSRDCPQCSPANGSPAG
jgi:hypothetical protein